MQSPRSACQIQRQNDDDDDDDDDDGSDNEMLRRGSRDTLG